MENHLSMQQVIKPGPHRITPNMLYDCGDGWEWHSFITMRRGHEIEVQFGHDYTVDRETGTKVVARFEFMNFRLHRMDLAMQADASEDEILAVAECVADYDGHDGWSNTKHRQEPPITWLSRTQGRGVCWLTRPLESHRVPIG